MRLDFKSGTFRAKGDIVGNISHLIKVNVQFVLSFGVMKLKKFTEINPLTGKTVAEVELIL